MAHAWFDIYSNLTSDQRLTLQEELNGKTLVGEYVGNQDYQHLVSYQKTTILFYALVDNYSPDICLPITKTMSLLTRIGLDKVTM
jgi:hypothetical protein